MPHRLRPAVREPPPPTASQIYTTYPDSDLLGFGPPLDGESDADYISRAARESGDTLFVFCLREFTGDDCQTLAEADQRLDRAVRDLLAIKTGLTARPAFA